MHVFSQTVHVSTRQSHGELQELIGKQEGPDACIQPRHRRKTQGQEGKGVVEHNRLEKWPFNVKDSIFPI